MLGLAHGRAVADQDACGAHGLLRCTADAGHLHVDGGQLRREGERASRGSTNDLPDGAGAACMDGAVNYDDPNTTTVCSSCGNGEHECSGRCDCMPCYRADVFAEPNLAT